MTTNLGSRWTESELQACVDAYAKMLADDAAAKPYVKREVIEGLLASGLSGRNRASIKYRMSNISAIMSANGRPYLDGYVPAANVGPTNTKRIAQMLSVKGLI